MSTLRRPAADLEQTGTVFVTQIIASVNNALNGCPEATPTPTPPADSSGSIVIFNDVRVDASNDPTLTLVSHRRSLVDAICFYAGGPAPSCTIESFAIQLAPLGTLQWQASAGTASVPPAPQIPFAGELICVQVDASQSPVSGEGFSGSLQNTNQLPHAAVTISGFETNDGDNNLCLGGGPAASCPFGAEYDACPAGVDAARIADCWNSSTFTFLCGG